MDLVEDNKKARKVDVHVVREYSEGKDHPAGSTECTSLGVDICRDKCKVRGDISQDWVQHR